MIEFKNLDRLIENVTNIVLKTSVHNGLIINIRCNQSNQWKEKGKYRFHVYCHDEWGGEGVISRGIYKKGYFLLFGGKKGLSPMKC